MTTIGKALLAAAAVSLIASCGGGGGGGSSGPPPTFAVSGTVTGITAGGLTLQLSSTTGTEAQAIGADSGFTFTTLVAAGSIFNVTVTSQPANESCAVDNGGGTMPGAAVTNVAVTCSALLPFTLAGLADPLASQQWHIRNTGQTAFADTPGVAGFDLNVASAYGLGYTGFGVTVAVVDSGLEILHEDLGANVVPNGSWNFNSSSTDPTNTAAATGDHGTSVAGLIAAARNSFGGIGSAPRARLKGFNLLSSNQRAVQFIDSLGGSGANPNSADVAIFNQSFGIETNTPTLVQPFEEAQYLAGVTALRGSKGAIYLKAAGNGFLTIGNVDCTGTGLTCENANFDPANTLPYQIIVGAINASGVKASYSTAGSAIWVSAPGGEFGLNAAVNPGGPANAYQPAMVTTDQSGCAKGFAQTAANTSTFNKGGGPNTSCNYTNTMNGTSSATPVLSGVIALMLEANPALSWRDVKHILASTAKQIDIGGGMTAGPLAGYVAEPGWLTNKAGFNYHNWYGFGLVDAAAAVNAARSYSANLGTFTDTGFLPSLALNMTIPDQSAGGATGVITVPAGQITFVEAVQLRVNITHMFDGDLGIELISPNSGTRSVLKNIEDGYFGADNLTNQVFLSNAFYGENPAGTWTIKVVDGLPGDTGTLNNWAIRIYGH